MKSIKEGKGMENKKWKRKKPERSKRGTCIMVSTILHHLIETVVGYLVSVGCLISEPEAMNKSV